MLSLAVAQFWFCTCRGGSLGCERCLVAVRTWVIFQALVDGKEVDIRKVNYLLRGIELEKGDHKIEFIYDSSRFKNLNTLAGISSSVLLLFFALLIFMDRRKKGAEIVEK